ncbi:MAG: hypothetical protein FWE23_10940 [Chitinivibrionia bacterium]|nr:hypothetical protein [Chitinivibrionia bacterium]
MKQLFMILGLMAAICFVFIGCSDGGSGGGGGNNNAIVGTWEHTWQSGEERGLEILIFNSDKTGISNSYEDDILYNALEFTWSIENGIVSMLNEYGDYSHFTYNGGNTFIWQDAKFTRVN